MTNSIPSGKITSEYFTHLKLFFWMTHLIVKARNTGEGHMKLLGNENLSLFHFVLQLFHFENQLELLFLQGFQFIVEVFLQIVNLGDDFQFVLEIKLFINLYLACKQSQLTSANYKYHGKWFFRVFHVKAIDARRVIE